MRYLCFLYTDNELRLENNSVNAVNSARQRAIEVIQGYFRG